MQNVIMNTPPNQSSHGKRPAAKRPPKTPISKSKREQHVRVKTAKGRRLGSTLWLERQLNDPYVQQAKRDGYRSRSVYKLKDIDEKHNLLHPAMGVVDLGSAPGGWSQYAVQKVNAQKGDGFVIGMDLHHVDPIVGSLQFKMDFTSHEMILPPLTNKPLSPLKPPAVGNTVTGSPFKTLSSSTATMVVKIAPPMARSHRGSALARSQARL